MTEIKKITAGLISDAMEKTYGQTPVSPSELAVMLEYPPDENMGDLAADHSGQIVMKMLEGL